MQLYLYCVTDCGHETQWSFFSDAYRVRNIPYLNIGIAVGQPLFGSGEITKENIFRHETIVEDIMTSHSVLPMKFGTLAANEAEVVQILQNRYCSFEKNLCQLKGKVELGLKVIWEENEKVTHAYTEYFFKRKQGYSPGTQYMLKKCRTNLRFELLQQEARELVNPLHCQLEQLSERNRLKLLVTPRLVMDAVYLVAKNKVKPLASEVARMQKEYPELKFLLSGPWPPYNFVGGNADGR